MEPAGEFECSDPLVNQLQRNIVWGQRGDRAFCVFPKRLFIIKKEQT
jgi:hypothetical protein